MHFICKCWIVRYRTDSWHTSKVTQVLDTCPSGFIIIRLKTNLTTLATSSSQIWFSDLSGIFSNFSVKQLSDLDNFLRFYQGFRITAKFWVHWLLVVMVVVCWWWSMPSFIFKASMATTLFLMSTLHHVFLTIPWLNTILYWVGLRIFTAYGRLHCGGVVAIV